VFTQMGACTGAFIAFSVPFIMPLSESSEVSEQNQGFSVDSHNWRLIFGLPFMIGLAQLLLLTLVFKHETPLFYLKKRDKSNYAKIMKLIYVGWKPDTDIELAEIKEVNRLIELKEASRDESMS